MGFANRKQSYEENQAVGLNMRVKNVKYLGEYKLQLQFSDKKKKIVDFKAKLQSAKGIFLPLKDPEYFKQVSIDDSKLSICWPNGADICPDVLYDMGDEVEEVIKAPKQKPKSSKKPPAK